MRKLHLKLIKFVQCAMEYRCSFSIAMACLQFFCSFFCLLITGCIAHYSITEIQDLSLKLQQLEIDIDKETQETENLLGLITNESVEKRSPQNCDVVGFHSLLTTTSVSVSSGGTIKFNHVITNVGGGYDSSTGTFTAPVAGYYQFIVTIMAQSGNTFISKVLIDGSDRYCRAYGSSQSQSQGMCAMIYYLTRGSTAKVTQYSGSALYGNGFSSFSGHLIG